MSFFLAHIHRNSIYIEKLYKFGGIENGNKN